MSTSLLIAWKYLISKKNGSTSIMLKVCFFAISLAVFSLTLIALIMNGFEFETKQKMQSIYPSIIMQSKNSYLNFSKIDQILQKEFYNKIASYAPSNIQYAILQVDEDSRCEDINNVVVIKGIDPVKELTISNLNTKINYKLFSNLEDLLQGERIILGTKLAQELKINLGSVVKILVPQEFALGKIGFESHKVFVSGIFNTGMDEFDAKFVIASLNLLKKFYPESDINYVGLKLKQGCDESEIISSLKSRFKLNVYSWKNLYPSIFSALKLEKYVMVFIFLLISLIAIMNIISLLFMFITQKNKDIAILKSMGFSYKNIKIIFLSIGMLVINFSALFGLILAYIAAKILENYPFIELPDVYYATHLPVKIEAYIFVEIFLVVALIGFFASIIPIVRIKNISINNLLRF